MYHKIYLQFLNARIIRNYDADVYVSCMWLDVLALSVIATATWLAG